MNARARSKITMDYLAMASDATSPWRPARRQVLLSESPALIEAPPTDAEEGDCVEPIPEQLTVCRYAPTLAEIRTRWPATVDVPTAGSVFGLSRSHAYELIKQGEFPAKVVRIGCRYRVVTESIIRAVSDEPTPESSG